MLKKLICTILLIVLMLTSFAFATFSASASLSDVDGSFDENLKFMESLDVIDGGFVNEQIFVTRGKFAEYVIRLMGVISNVDVEFADVPSSHPQYKYIAAAYNCGLLRGNGEGFVCPDEIITKWEASIICVRALCYDDIIRLGLPTEKVVSQSSITKGVEGDLLNVRNAFVMLKKLSNENILEQTVFGNGYAEFKKSDKTFLEYYRGIKRHEGVITTNETTSLTAVTGGGDNIVMCDEIRFNSEKTPYVQNLLGYLSEIYYMDNSRRDIVYASVLTMHINTLTVNAEDIIGFDGGELKYYSGQKEKCAKLNIDTDVLYNFVPCIPYGAEDFKISQGRLRFIDNNGDKEYDCVFVEEFDTFIVGEVSSQGIVTGKFTGDILNLEDDSKEYTFIDYKGNWFDAETLRNWDVLCIYKSRDGKKQRIVKCDAEFEGEVSEINGNKVYIDGTIYELSESFAEFGLTVSPGKSYVFYMDVCGRIAGYNTEFYSDSFSFGYLVGISRSKGLDTSLSVKLLSQSGELKVYAVADSTIVDAKTYKDVDMLYEALGGDNFESKPARYKISNGHICNVDTIMQGGGGESDSLHMFYSGYDFTDSDGNCTTVAREVKKLRYKATPMIFGAKISTSENTKVAIVPKDVSEIAVDNAYRMTDISYFADDEDYYIEAYKTIPEAHDAQYLVIYKDISGKTELTNKETNISVIDEVSEVLDENGDKTYKLSYYTRGNYHSEYVCETDVLDNIKADGESYMLKKGDVVRLETDDDGKISVCLFVYSPSKDFLNISNPSSTDVNAKPRFQMAYVYEKYGSNIRITRDNLMEGETYNYTIDDLESKNASKYAIMVYDSKKDYLSVGDVSDIFGYTNTSGTMWSKVFVADRYGNPNTLVIYK